MRLDHLLSKEMDSKGCYVVKLSRNARNAKRRLGISSELKVKKLAGGDALMGHTRTHPEHEG